MKHNLKYNKIDIIGYDKNNFLSIIAPLRGRVFAVSPPVQLFGSIYMGIYCDKYNENNILCACVRVPMSELLSFSDSLFGLGGSHIYVHALKEMIRWFACRNINIASDCFLDVSIAAYLLSPPERDRDEGHEKFMLKSLLWDYLGETYPFLPLEIREHGALQALYRCLAQDAARIWKLGEKILPMIAEDAALDALYHEVEMPLIPVLAEMEHEGIGLRRQWIARARVGMRKACVAVGKELRELYGQPVNPFAADEVKTFLRRMCGERIAESQLEGDDTLKGLSRTHRPARKVWMLRRLLRALEFFESVYGLEKCHPTWWMTRASVGRIICTDPPIQNLMKAFRVFLDPGRDQVFIKADFSAFQLRLLSHLSQDPALQEVFATGSDPHGETVRRLREHGIQITRDQAKIINFSICYDGTAWSLKDQLGVAPREAYNIMVQLKQVYPAVKPFLDSVVTDVSAQEPRQRCVRSLFGRRRCVKHDGKLTWREKRQIRNAVVQMLEVDVFKKTVLAVHQAIGREGLPVRIAFLLHDAIWFTCPRDADMVRKAKEVIQEVMENTVQLQVPLRVEWQS